MVSKTETRETTPRCESHSSEHSIDECTLIGRSSEDSYIRVHSSDLGYLVKLGQTRRTVVLERHVSWCPTRRQREHPRRPLDTLSLSPKNETSIPSFVGVARASRPGPRASGVGQDHRGCQDRHRLAPSKAFDVRFVRKGTLSFPARVFRTLGDFQRSSPSLFDTLKDRLCARLFRETLKDRHQASLTKSLETTLKHLT